MGLPAEVAELIGNVKHICVLTGAGISAESGLATFQGKEGLWANYRPEELATPEAFRGESAAGLEVVSVSAGDRWPRFNPTPGMRLWRAGKRWSRISYWLHRTWTDLHQVAGSRRVLRTARQHPSQPLLALRCRKYEDDSPYSGEVPLCACGGMLRPGVVWFGEALPEAGAAAGGDSARRRRVILCNGRHFRRGLSGGGAAGTCAERERP